jgi:hypothetical protein
MLTGLRMKGCARCGGDLLEEAGIAAIESHVRSLSCLQCGELQFVDRPPRIVSVADLRGRPGRPRKVQAP